MRGFMRKSLWKAIPLPDQVKRLLIVVVIMAAIVVGIRGYFIPESFGEYGHYRAVSVDSIAALGIHYAGHQACVDCHDDIYELKDNSYHRTVNCEACHGPAAEHAETGGDVEPLMPRDRGYCTLCHIYNPAKPTGFPQIDPIAHNPGKRCISCHDPHAPAPPDVPEECSACHASISRTKALSPHAPLSCTDCHTAPEDHKSNPRLKRASKPTRREDCGKCHAQKAGSEKYIPRIDMETHGEQYLCWQCHYPHFPEVK